MSPTFTEFLHSIDEDDAINVGLDGRFVFGSNGDDDDEDDNKVRLRISLFIGLGR